MIFLNYSIGTFTFKLSFDKIIELEKNKGKTVFGGNDETKLFR